MVDVKLLLINTLTEEFNLPVIQQGSMSMDDEYPESFFTFWNNTTSDSAFYDDTETETIWDFDLNFYSDDPTSVNTILLEAKTLLKGVGFIVDGSGYDVMSDEKTHTGRGINLLFIERK
jgi:hypothetical protein